MEAESIQSLTPLLNQADQWREVLLLLPLLVALEAVLSADNAIALAAIARGLEDPARQRQALNLGLALALAALLCGSTGALLARAALRASALTPLESATLRLAAAAVVMLPLLWRLPPPGQRPRLGWRRWLGL